MKAIILAGGRGKRLKKVTKGIPKVLVKINGKPLIEHTIERLRNFGVEEIGVVINYKGELIKSKIGDSIKYFKQKETLGTADALRYAENFVKDENKFLVLCGDILFSDDIKNMLKMKTNVIGVREVKDASRFGRIVIKDGYITDIVEKDGKKTPGLINTGIYIFDNRIFDAIRKTKLSKREEYELTDSIKILISEGVKFKYFKIDEWIDIGVPEDLERAKLLFEGKL